MPLNLAVLPWGLLAGSMAVQAGLTTTQAVAMSAVMFAGAAQLLSLNMLQEGQSFFAILFSAFVLTTQHLLYGLNFRALVQF
ncbi:AzlC family ABC transporter permease [Acinetobacter thermotolerans]